MPIVPIRIPQLGEGLQEALLVEFIKQPGDSVKRDDPIYTMETDKANSDVESPYDGTVVAWTAEVGTVLPIGAAIGTMEVAEGTKEMASGHGPPDEQPAAALDAAAPTSVAQTNGDAPRPKVLMPPKTRKYLKDLGLFDVAHEIPAAGTKLMPDDVDRYVAGGGSATPSPTSTEAYDESPLPAQQQTLNYRLIRGAQVCVPVTVVTDADWTRLDAERAAVKAQHADAAERSDKASGKASSGPSAFVMMLWCVTQVLKDHPGLRSTLDASGKILRTYKHVNLGIAVALPGDLMVTAVIKDADTLDRAAFYDAAQAQIALAREGKDQADAATTLTVSNMGTAGMEIGIPAVVAPAVATLVLGKTFWQPVPDGQGGFDFTKTAKLSLTFDHRIVNGVGGGHFLSDVAKAIASFERQTA